MSARRTALPSWHRWSLWAALVLLLACMLATLVWLAGRHEAGQIQERLGRDAATAIADIRFALARNQQSLAVLGTGAAPNAAWQEQTAALLQAQRELVRIEWRGADLHSLAQAQSPYHPIDWSAATREDPHGSAAMACANARRLATPAYAGSYFQPYSDGLGAELLELCLPLAAANGRMEGFIVATYALQDLLSATTSHNLAGNQEVSFTDPDGTRLALIGATQRSARLFTTQQLLNLNGTALVLRMDGWHSEPHLFPSLVTALVAAMAVALAGVVAMLVRDNRRRLHAERELGEALAFRQAMEESLVAGLRARDLGGRVTYVNQAFCAMVGFSAQELLGRGMPAPYWPPELAAMYQQSLHRRSPQTAHEGLEAQYQRKDGTRLDVLIFETPLLDAQGQHQGWMSAVLDVSEQRRVEAQSRAAQERLEATAHLATVGEMASLLSHEINQPLAAISSYATGALNLLAPGGASDAGDAGTRSAPREDLRSAVQHIADQAARAGRVVQGVHNLVRRRGQAREPVAAEALLGAVLPLIHLQARANGVRLVSSVEPGLPPALCERTMVEQVLLNLARNAIQAMEDTPPDTRVLELQVRAALPGAQGAWLEFVVVDGGKGIAPEVAAQLFTPFFTTRAQGTGLGLNLCRTVVEQHGGVIRFAANAPRGMVFLFTLPAGQSRNLPE
ncbi:MAG: PAS domain-containing sensor histidine kinase [Comamonadaceae bacterium SCN 68-20]|nr:MAG: PAS domain-containing sensor histidine kinase [Comamonadaceae bacterium SCN 68-20]OJX35620.1 MAG: PAS domain-containing sensor histidine kinase [Burkholderiales bacterium 68-20]